MHPELMSCLLRATFTVKISSSCQQISAFPRTFFHLFFLFPSFSFLSIFCFVLSFFMSLQLPWSLLFHQASLIPFLFSGKSFPLLSLFLFFNGRLFYGQVGLSLNIFFLCSLEQFAWGCGQTMPRGWAFCGQKLFFQVCLAFSFSFGSSFCVVFLTFNNVQRG